MSAVCVLHMRDVRGVEGVMGVDVVLGYGNGSLGFFFFLLINILNKIKNNKIYLKLKKYKII